MIEQIAIGIFWTWGVHCSFKKGHIFGNIGKAIEQIIGSWWSKPLFACPPCMGGFHGLLLVVFYFNLSLFESFIFIVALIGANFIIKEHLYEDIQPED